MKMFKSAVAVLLCFVMLVSFAACGKKGDGADTSDENGKEISQLTDAETKTLEEAGLSLDNIISANRVESLMKKYNSVTVKTQYSDGTQIAKQVLSYDGGLVFAQKNTESNGAESVSGWIKGFEFIVEGDRVKAYRDVTELDKEPVFGNDEMISSFFEGKELAVAGDSQEYHILKSLSEDKADASERYFYIEKETLALTKITYKNAVGKTEDTAVAYNGEPEDFTKKITDAFDGELKTVTVNGEFDGGVKISVKLQLPSDWEYVPTGDGRIDYYMDKAMTQGYVYPGDGEDYTLYISNIFNEVDNGKK